MARSRCTSLKAASAYADTFGPDVGDAVAVCIGRVRTWLPGQIGAHAVGRREARTLPDQDDDAVGAKSSRDRVANRHAPLANDNEGSDPPAVGAQRRHGAGENRPRMGCNRACRQAIGDDKHNVVVPGMRRQHRFGTRRQPAAEIGSHQIPLSIGGRARDRQHWRCKLRQVVAKSAAKSAASRTASNDSCTASRARACASWKSSSGPVASEAPVRSSPIRAAVSLATGRPFSHTR